jgi:Asp-tRNA(Asn)/Glu-tRNA(Gln) amidotransferase A subunit family amidase
MVGYCGEVVMLRHWVLILKVLMLIGPVSAFNAVAAKFNVLETSIADVHRAFTDESLTCLELTQIYLRRIEFYDQSTGLNSIIMVNPDATVRATTLDAEFAATGTLKPLHCVPMIIKDNYNVRGLQTTAGSKAMLGFMPEKDAWQIARIREAGALVLGKSNMAEWAFSPRVTISSVAGETRNPYNLNHVPAGSSGGTAAAVAANFGLAGLGTDTGNSIRGPSSHTALVGIRSTLGLTSRSGIVPLFLRNDVGGPMARSVADAVRILQVIAGPDSADPITEYARGQYPDNFVELLYKGALSGIRIGVMRHLSERDHDPRVKQLFESALKDLVRLGAIIVDPIAVADFDTISANHWCRMFKHDLNVFLRDNASRSPRKNLQEIVDTGLYSAYIAEDLKGNAAVVDPVSLSPPCQDLYHDERRVAFRKAIVGAMDKASVAAVVYPSWNFPPARIGYPDDYKGDNNQVIAPHTGLPAVTVPMGFIDDLPAGLQFVGRLFSEATILPLIYAFEQGTQHRVAPKGFAALAPTLAPVKPQ